MSFEEITAGGAAALGIPLPEGAVSELRHYVDALLRANKDFNLTAIEDPESAARLHILDSLGVLTMAELECKSVIDVGTGGGLPGLALKIARPELHLTLLDATEKKVGFLENYTRKRGIEAKCLCARAEEAGRDPEYRERYDIAVSRAVARLNVLAEICLPFVRVGGKFLAMKAYDSDVELNEAANAIKTLGGSLRKVHEYTVPGTEITRRVVEIAKLAPTLPKYPRRWSAIQKKPL